MYSAKNGGVEFLLPERHRLELARVRQVSGPRQRPSSSSAWRSFSCGGQMFDGANRSAVQVTLHGCVPCRRIRRRLTAVGCKILQFSAELVHCVTRKLEQEKTLREHARVRASWLEGSLVLFEGIARRLSARRAGAAGRGRSENGRSCDVATPPERLRFVRAQLWTGVNRTL